VAVSDPESNNFKFDEFLDILPDLVSEALHGREGVETNIAALHTGKDTGGCWKVSVETFSLLPANHFGARTERSAEQTLLLLQEHIYNIAYTDSQGKLAQMQTKSNSIRYTKRPSTTEHVKNQICTSLAPLPRNCA
jgi:hypothetical protein